MFDRVVRSLIHVKYVLDLKKNLVSLGYLERNDFSFNCYFGIGVLNIIKESMVVMRGKRLENNLYQINGSMICGASATTATIDGQ